MADKKEKIQRLRTKWEEILLAFEREANLQSGQILVIGCSTSEVVGERIGKAGSKEIADILIDPLLDWTAKLGVYLAFQCCEHLNRVLVVEQKCMEKYGLEPVIVLPALSAGGALAQAAWHKFAEPVAVEQIKAHAGIDIGDTLIGMHLRQVVVPIRLDITSLGSAHLTFAKTRPKYIGGPRATYPCV